MARVSASGFDGPPRGSTIRGQSTMMRCEGPKERLISGASVESKLAAGAGGAGEGAPSESRVRPGAGGAGAAATIGAGCAGGESGEWYGRSAAVDAQASAHQI